MWSKAIAIHTFVVVMWGPYRHPYFVAYATVGLTWFFLVFFIAISVSVHTHGSDFYYTPVGVSLSAVYLSCTNHIWWQYWCWIGNHYRAEQFTGQYIWIWISMFVSFLTYVPLFFWARGNITVSPTYWWKFRVHRGNDIGQDGDPDGRKRRSIRMIVSVMSFTPKIPIIWIPCCVSQIPHRIRRGRPSIQCGPLENTLQQCCIPFTCCNIWSVCPIRSLWRI